MAGLTEHGLRRICAQAGYAHQSAEKAVRLLELLAEINRDPFLADRLALKGGTALNLFHLHPDRLSVDIDLNYVGFLDRSKMMGEREEVNGAINMLLGAHGYSILRVPQEHAGGKWSTRFNSVFGGNATLEVDINYMQRQPLFGAMRMNSRAIGGVMASDALVLDIHEVVAGKMVALVDRRTARDLFDARRILSVKGLDWRKIKAGMLALGVCGRDDWRKASVKAITGPSESLGKLRVCLPQGHFSQYENEADWIEETVELCREKLAFLFDLSTNERSFLNAVLDHGEIKADLLEVDVDTQKRISAMPMLAWKAQNVREYRTGMSDG